MITVAFPDGLVARFRLFHGIDAVPSTSVRGSAYNVGGVVA